MPSGLLWAKANIGASSPEQPGMYFSWGNIEGHVAGTGYDFSQEVYNTTPGAAVSANLSLDHDAARESLGAPWRMPSDIEFQELYDNCTKVWTSLNGLNGILFISNVNGRQLFFPAAGYYHDTTLTGRGSIGGYWSRSFVSETNARFLYFNESEVEPQNNGQRRSGFSIRAVRSA